MLSAKRAVEFLLIATACLALGSACVKEEAAPTATPTGQVSAATESTPTATSAAAPVTVTDDLGREVTLQSPPQRIVSLAPGNTESLFALGLGARIVGTDDFSDYPEAARSITKVGGFQPSVEKILALEPDLVVTVRGDPAIPEQLEKAGVAVAVLDPQGLSGVLADIRLLGKLTGTEERAEALAEEMKAKFDAIEDKTQGATRPRVFYEVDASDPSRPYTAGPGSFVDALITLAGGENIASGAASMWPQLSAEAVVAKDPEVILLGDAAFGVTAEKVASRSGWGGITAVKKGAVFAVDPNLTTRPGPRLTEGLLLIAKILHPELFP